MTFLLETLALSFAAISHVSIIQDTPFHQQRKFISIGIIGGLLLSGAITLILKICNISVEASLIAAILLVLQSLESLALRLHQSPSPLQLTTETEATEGAERKRDSMVHFGAPLADGFLLGFLPASLITTRASIDTPALLLTLLAGCLLLFASKAKRTPQANLLGVESPEQIQKRRAGFFKVIPVALSIFLGTSILADSILAGLHLFICSWYFSLLCSSLVERGRFLGISVFIILGKFGTAFMTGFFAAIAVCFLPSFFGLDSLAANELRTILGILFIEGFCTISTKKGTVCDAIEKSAVDEGTEPHPREKRQSHWRNRVNEVAQTYELTSRQQEVFLRLARGRGAQFIAEDLCISLPTAKSHIYNIYLKLGIHSRQELLNLVDFNTEDAIDQ